MYVRTVDVFMFRFTLRLVLLIHFVCPCGLFHVNEIPFGRFIRYGYAFCRFKAKTVNESRMTAHYTFLSQQDYPLSGGSQAHIQTSKVFLRTCSLPHSTIFFHFPHRQCPDRFFFNLRFFLVTRSIRLGHVWPVCSFFHLNWLWDRMGQQIHIQMRFGCVASGFVEIGSIDRSSMEEKFAEIDWQYLCDKLFIMLRRPAQRRQRCYRHRYRLADMRTKRTAGKLRWK